jgi:DNA-binding protein HU-beta
MTKAFITEVLQVSCELTQAEANAAATDLVNAIVDKLKQEERFLLPGFGAFTVAKTKAHTGMNPRTQEKIKVKAGKTVRFKASPVLKRTVTASRQL